MADSVRVQFSASIGALINGVEDAKKAIGSVRESVDNVTSGAKSLLEAFGVAFSVDRVIAFVNSMADLGERTESMAAMFGVSTQEIGRLDAIAKATGTSTQLLARGIETFQVNLQHAQQPTSQQAQALHALGVSAKDFIGLSIDQQLDKFADAVSHFADGGNKLAAVRVLFGRMGDDLIPLFDNGAAGMRELADMGERAGTILDGQTAAAFEHTHLALTELGMSIEGLGIRAFKVLEPAIDSAARAVTNFIEGLNANKVETALKTIGTDAVGIGETIALAFVTLKERFDEFVASVQNGMPVLHTAAAASLLLLGQAGAAFTQLKAAYAGGAPKSLADIETGADKARAAVEALADQYRTNIATFSAGAGDTGGSGGAKPQVSPINTNVGNQTAELESHYQGMIKQIDDFYALQKEHLSSAVAQHQISYDQESAALLQALDARRAGEDAAFDAEIAAAKAAGKNYEAVVKQKIAADGKWQLEHDKIIETTLQKDEKEWQSALQPLQSAFNSQLRSLLSGTETWAQAMKKIFSDLVIQAIEALEKLAVEKAAAGLAGAVGGGPQSLVTGLLGGGSQAAQTANTTALTTLSASVNTLNLTLGGHAIATAANTGASLTNTSASAVNTGGLLAHMGVLTVNTLAIIPNTLATVANTIATAVSHLLPSFDVGSWSVPGDMTARIHRGEVILPNDGTADAFRSGQLGGGGGNVTHHHTYHISGSQSPRDTAKAVTRAWQRNPSLRPAH